MGILRKDGMEKVLIQVIVEEKRGKYPIRWIDRVKDIASSVSR